MRSLKDIVARSPRFAVALAGIVAIALASALYGTFRGGSNLGAAECVPAAAVAERLKPFAKGEMAALAVAETPAPLPPLAFEGPDGKPLSLADFRGKTLVVNLWATWCAPCRKEMPALDRLQALEGGPAFEVVALNLDTRNFDKPREWLKEAGIGTLAYYADREAKVFQILRQAGRALGMPTTYLVDAKGCTLATLNGAADWAGEDARALIGAVLAKAP